MFSDIQHLQDLLVISSLKAAPAKKGRAAAKTIAPNSNKTATKEADAAQDPTYPNDILAYVLSCTNDDDDNTICTFV